MEQQVASKKNDAYLYYRLRLLPDQIDRAYRRLEHLQREARRLGMHHLIREIEP